MNEVSTGAFDVAEPEIIPENHSIFGISSNIIGSNGTFNNNYISSLDQYRMQLYNYALSIERLSSPQYNQMSTLNATTFVCAGSNTNRTIIDSRNMYNPNVASLVPDSNRLAFSMSLYPHRIFSTEDPKPQHSYIGLIAMAILSSAESKLVLSDIYQYILENYPYFRTRGPGWRNSIRHNLSLNDCFIKSGRSANGKGHYWAVHPANIDDFRKGDFRRRKAQRKVRRHMGLSVDDTGTDSPSPPPLDLTAPTIGINFTTPNRKNLDYLQRESRLSAAHFQHQNGLSPVFGARHFSIPARYGGHVNTGQNTNSNQKSEVFPFQYYQEQQRICNNDNQQNRMTFINKTTTTASVISNLCSQTRKRQFDVASLLAPDMDVAILENKDCSEHCASPSLTTTTQTQHTVITKVSVQKQRHKFLRSMSPEHGIHVHLSEIEDQEDIDVVASDSSDSVQFNIQSDVELENNYFASTSPQSSLDVNSFSSQRQTPTSDTNDLAGTEISTKADFGQDEICAQQSSPAITYHNSIAIAPRAIQCSKPYNPTLRFIRPNNTAVERSEQNFTFLMKQMNNQSLDKPKDLTRLDHELLERWHGSYVARRIKTVDLTAIDNSNNYQSDV